MIKPIHIGMVIVIFLTACQMPKPIDQKPEATDVIGNTDTLIGTKIIKNEIAGGAYRRKATGYFIVINKDTSKFSCIFTESNEGVVGIDLNLPYERTLTHNQRMKEFEKLLPAASTDYNFDSLKSMSLGRLILSGDLAIDVTKKFRDEYPGKLPSYNRASDLMKQTRLATDYNSLLAPYSIIVDQVSIEKLFYASKKELLHLNAVETDTAAIPLEILDCITWLRLRKVQ